MIETLNFYFSQILPSLYTYVCMYAFIIFALNPSLENKCMHKYMFKTTLS